LIILRNGQRRVEEGRGGQRRAEVGRGGQRMTEEGRGGQKMTEKVLGNSYEKSYDKNCCVRWTYVWIDHLKKWAAEGRGGQRRAEEGRGGQRRAEKGRRGQRRGWEIRTKKLGWEIFALDRLICGLIILKNGQRRVDEGWRWQRRAEEDKGGQRRVEEGRGGQRRTEDDREGVGKFQQKKLG
jgi:hypothetical protein